jgi:hypothetical protein
MSTPATLTAKLRKAYEDGTGGKFRSASSRASEVIQEAGVLLAAGPSPEDEETLWRLLGAATALQNGIADIAEASTRATEKAVGDWTATFDRRPFRQNGRR